MSRIDSRQNGELSVNAVLQVLMHLLTTLPEGSGLAMVLSTTSVPGAAGAGAPYGRRGR